MPALTLVEPPNNQVTQGFSLGQRLTLGNASASVLIADQVRRALALRYASPMRALLLIAATALALPTQAQWTIQSSNTTADLRGIANAGNGIAWASGTEGTVLRTTDTGKTWQRCPTPPNADHLDFRGIQALDANTAIVMSSGKGDLSRLYKTTDACQTWKLVFTNPDKEGFWDALLVRPDGDSFILGDPVKGEFKLFCKMDDDPKWAECWNEHPIKASGDEAVFAASNSSLFTQNGFTIFGTGGPDGAQTHLVNGMTICVDDCSIKESTISGKPNSWVSIRVPLGNKTQSSGIFSIAARQQHAGGPFGDNIIIAVGGDYLKPNDPTSTAAVSTDGGESWLPATTPTHGYRSAVAYSPTIKTWITVGPNGTDISTDDGRNWHPLKPSPTDTPDADRHWNALSLPFVVGPHGRIGILNPTALK
jgi:photosystem II stability/assembly factor-like uncharacterized protein